MFARLRQRDRDALSSRPPDTSDAVDVGLRRRRHLVVDDVGELIDVETTGSDVGGHEQLGGSTAHPPHDTVALLLAHAAVERFGAIAATVERLGQLVDFGAGPAEHDGRRRCLDVEDPAECSGLVRAGDDVRALAYERRLARRGRGSRDLDAHRVVQVAAGDAGDPGRDRGREQHRLALVRRRVEDRLEVFGEAHVEHLVRLVEHDDLHGVEPQRAATDVVERSTRGGDDDVDAAGQCVELPSDVLAAIDRQDSRPQLPAVLVDRLGHLHRQLAGGHEDERDELGLAAGAGDTLQHRQGECGGLPGARGGLSDEVVTLEQWRDRLPLDRCRLFVPEGGERGEQLGPQAELTEAGALLRRLGDVRSATRRLRQRPRLRVTARVIGLGVVGHDRLTERGRRGRTPDALRCNGGRRRHRPARTADR